MWPKSHIKNSVILVDSLARIRYNKTMMKEQTMTATRKKRSDRNHIIYEIVGAKGSYIGVTAKTESTVLKSIRARAAKHFYRAKTETKDWALCEFLRTLTSKEEVDIRVRELVRGKAEAHRRERELIRELNPFYNTDKRGV
jgi:hypothetical protein